jgi:hypothetical protein
MNVGFRNSIIMLLPLLLTCGAAQASEWVIAAHSADGTNKVLIDVSSIRIVAGIRHAWDKLVPTRHTMKGFGDNANKAVIYEVAKNAFNCSEETMKAEALIIYYEDGTNETLMPEALHQGWEAVPPDTMISDEMQFICAWKPK